MAQTPNLVAVESRRSFPPLNLSLARDAWHRVPLPLAMFALAAVLRIADFALFYIGSLITGHHGHIDFSDALYYDKWAWYVADHLRSGQLVDVRRIELAGTYDVGFQYFVGLQYFVVGHHPEVPRLLNTLLAAFCAPGVYLAGRRTVIGERAARRAGWLMAVWPLSIYWSGYDLIKEPLACFLIVLAMFSITARRRVQSAVLGAASTAFLLLVRSYVGIGLFLLLPLAAALRRDWRRLIAVMACLIVAEAALVAAGQPAVYSFGPYVGNGLPFVTQLLGGGRGGLQGVAGRAVGDPEGRGLQKVEGGTNVLALLHLPPQLIAERTLVGTVVTLLGPRPAWKDIVHPTLDTAMYPGLLVWIVLLPFTVLGFARAVRRRDPVELALAALALGLLLALSFFYGGVFRQREMIWPPMLLFTGTGLLQPWPARWWRAYAAVMAGGTAILLLRVTGIF